MDESQKPFKYMPSPRLMRLPLVQNSTSARFVKIYNGRFIILLQNKQMDESQKTF